MTDQNMSAMPANGAADEAAMRDWAERLGVWVLESGSGALADCSGGAGL